MKRLLRLLVLLALPWPAVPPLLFASTASAGVRGAGDERLQGRLGNVHIPFIVNVGQTDSAVAYYAPTFAGTVYVTREGQIVYSLPGRGRRERGAAGPPSVAASAGWSLTETPVGRTGRKARPFGEQRSQSQVAYFIGNDPSLWRSSIATYDGVSLGEVWPGVRVSLRAYGKNVEKLFTVQPGGDPSRIRMRVSGAESLWINKTGALVIGTGPGEVTLTPALAYQDKEGSRRAVPVAYELHGRDYGFRLGRYDARLPVVIDPLLQSTYLGGSGVEEARALAIYPTSGEVYVAGETTSRNFPGTAGGAQPANGGGYDAFVARLNAALTTLNQATYLGGSGGDAASALVIHPTSRDVYVVGTTNSTNFPGTAGGAQPAYGAGGFPFGANAFVARLNAALTTLNQATYLGGSRFDVARALAIHPTSGDVYVAGDTDSRNFPGTAGGAQPANATGGDSFVARLNAALTTLNQATYLGGSGLDAAFALAIHPTSGEVYVAGETRSTNFPGTAGGAQPVFGGFSADAFVARLNAALTTLNQATYLGGSRFDIALALAIHPTSGEVYVAGHTGSTDFPGTAGGAQPANASGGDPFGVDAFVARLNAALTTLNQATYLGGSRSDIALALAIHPTSGEVYVAGETKSTNFPGTAGGAQPVYGSAGDQFGADAFVARLNAALTTLNQATYLGGSGVDAAGALAIHPMSGEVYVAGGTDFRNFPGTAGGAQPAGGGGRDAFLARLTADLGALSPAPGTPIPTLSGWMKILLGLALAASGIWLLRLRA